MRLILSTGKIFEEQDILNKIDRETERDRRFDKSINILPSIRRMKIYKSIDISVNFDDIAKKEEEKAWKVKISGEKILWFHRKN